MSEFEVLGGLVLGFLLGIIASEYFGVGLLLVRALVLPGRWYALQNRPTPTTTTTHIQPPTTGTEIVPKNRTPVSRKQLGILSKLPLNIRRQVWRLLVHQIDDYIPFDSRPAGVLRKNKINIPTMLLVSRALSDEFAVELYNVNKVLQFPINPHGRPWRWENCHPFGPKAHADFSRFDRLRVDIHAPPYRTWTFFPVETWLTQVMEEVRGLELLFMWKFRALKMAGKKCPRVEITFSGAGGNGRVGDWWKESASVLAPITGKEFDQDERAEISALLRALNKRYLAVGVVFVLDPALDHELGRAHRARQFLKEILAG